MSSVHCTIFPEAGLGFWKILRPTTYCWSTFWQPWTTLGQRAHSFGSERSLVIYRNLKNLLQLSIVLINNLIDKIVYLLEGRPTPELTLHLLYLLKDTLGAVAHDEEHVENFKELGGLEMLDKIADEVRF